MCLLGYFGSGSTSILGALSSSSSSASPNPRPLAHSGLTSTLKPTLRVSDYDEVHDADCSSSPYLRSDSDCNHHFKTDCTVRKATHKHCPDFFVTETISLVHEFPQCLLEAFASNFDELRAADCLLHTVDVTDPHWQRQEIAVLSLLNSLGGGLENTNIITVWNKVDVFDNADMVERIRAEAAFRMKTVAGIPQHPTSFSSCNRKYLPLWQCIRYIPLLILSSPLSTPSERKDPRGRGGPGPVHLRHTGRIRLQGKQV